MVELLFLPSVYAPCSACHSSRYNPQTLEIERRGRNIAQVLEMTVDDACAFFTDEPQRIGTSTWSRAQATKAVSSLPVARRRRSPSWRIVLRRRI